MSATAYRELPGFPGYLIGDDGSVWSCRHSHGGLQPRWRRLKAVPEKRSSPCGRRRGYLYVKPCRDGRSVRVLVHRAVLLAFVGPCPAGMEGCHEDNNPANNALSNLRWDTRIANHADKRRHGTQPGGERHHWTKLTDADVATVRQLHRDKVPPKEIARRLNISRATVSRLVNNLYRRTTP